VKTAEIQKKTTEQKLGNENIDPKAVIEAETKRKEA
jgi:hypothetical protein